MIALNLDIDNRVRKIVDVRKRVDVDRSGLADLDNLHFVVAVAVDLDGIDDHGLILHKFDGANAFVGRPDGPLEGLFALLQVREFDARRASVQAAG